ncbi:MAG: nucleotidyl transferase AbiEii/AbiGii toxin family protein [Pseudonocardiaceae bacterium]
MLDPVEGAAVAEQFGVAAAQVRRDHLISHLLAALSVSLVDELVFFGGTALARSLVPDGRLSEDIDLLAIGRRRDVVGVVERQLVQGVRREYPGLWWEPPLSAVRDVEPAVLRALDGTMVRVQLLAPTGVAPWPVELRELFQRYSDAPPARLRVPTAASFAAWKMIAWLDRAAARDLYDLWALAQIGAIDELAVDLFVRYGPTGRPPSVHRFEHPPDEIRWRRDLAGQVQLGLTAVEAFEQVRLAWRRAIGQQ